MNTKFKILAWLLMATSLITFSSCERDLYEQSIQNSSRNISVSKVSLSGLDKNIASKINEKISLIKKQKIKSNKQNKFEYNNLLGIYIDTENGKLVNNNGKLYYTFPMFRKNEEKLENIIFTPLESGEIDTYIAKYNLKPEEFNDLTDSQIQSLSPEYQKLMLNNWYIVCIESVVLTGYTPPLDNGELTGNFGYEPVWETTGQICYMIDNSEGGGEPGNGSSNTNTDNGQVPGTVGIGDNSNISTTVVLSPQQILIKDFVRSLTPTQLAWYNNNPESQQNINDAITSVQQNGINSATIIQMIDLCITNHTTFVINESITPSNSLNFDNIDDLQNFIYTQENNGSDIEYEQDGNQKTARVKLAKMGVFGGINFRVKQNMTPTYSIEDVTSSAYGFTLSFSWEQTNYDSSISGNVATVNVEGDLHYNVFMEGIGTVWTEQIKVQIKLNTTNGTIISAVVIP